MQKLGISLLFFTLCFTSGSFAQDRAEHYGSFPNIDSLLSQLNIDSIVERVNVDSILRQVNIDSIVHTMNIDSILHQINIDSLWKANRYLLDNARSKAGLVGDSVLKYLKRFVQRSKPLAPYLREFTIPDSSGNVNRHYFTKNGERYYLNIIPPAHRGTRVDGSDVWLLGMR